MQKEGRKELDSLRAEVGIETNGFLFLLSTLKIPDSKHTLEEGEGLLLPRGNISRSFTFLPNISSLHFPWCLFWSWKENEGKKGERFSLPSFLDTKEREMWSQRGNKNEVIRIQEEEILQSQTVSVGEERVTVCNNGDRECTKCTLQRAKGENK